MKDYIYEIYLKCFPEFHMDYDVFLKNTAYEESEVIVLEENEVIIGFSIILNNAILLLCIEPSMQNKGFGTNLLAMSEDKIKGYGYDTVILGRGSTYIFPGVPIINDKTSYPFFEKHGYAYSLQSVDMIMKLEDFDIDKTELRPVSSNVRFQYYDKSNEADLLNAVAMVEESWVQYYKTAEESILLAIEDGRILGFEIITEDINRFNIPGYDKIGAVGCVGVIPEARQKGIGLWLAAYGMNDLKLNKCDGIFIGFTYYENWYAKLGCRTTTRYYMCEKSL